MYISIWKFSRPQARESNGQGIVFTDTEVATSHICSQHRYESLILPVALQYLWPRKVDYEALVARVTSEKYLKVVAQVHDDPDVSVVMGKQDLRPSRSMKTLRSRLSREVCNVSG